MKARHQLIARIKDQSGVTAIVVAIVIPILIGITALAVDIGYVMATRNELQNVADAAALAATRQLGAIYQGMTYAQQQSYVCDPLTIRPIAKEVAGKNQAAKMSITLNDADIIIGDWHSSTLTLAPTLVQPDAVRVIARRDGGVNGPITTFFARILGIDTVDVTATATAALTGQGTAEPGELELPIGISRWFFDEGACNHHIKFYPTNDPDSCAGWNTFTTSPSNDPGIRDILEGSDTSPRTIAGDTMFEFTGGTLSTPTFDALLTLFQHNGYDVDSNGDAITDASGNPVVYATAAEGAVPLEDADGNRLLYPDGTPRNEHRWDTTVAVYDWDDCSNPNTGILIVGFTRVALTDIQNAPNKTLIGLVLCDYTDSGDSRGGGGEYGTKGSIPGLVE
jgi:hypothetical protein